MPHYFRYICAIVAKKLNLAVVLTWKMQHMEQTLKDVQMKMAQVVDLLIALYP